MELWSGVAPTRFRKMALYNNIKTALLKKNSPHAVISYYYPCQRKDAKCPTIGPNSKRYRNITTGEFAQILQQMQLS